MIVREQPDGFIMIEQDHHARVSGDMIRQWNTFHLPNSPFQSSLFLAIDQHDGGWKAYDQDPFWNDYHQVPYSFTDFPNPAKTLLYTNGIENVEAHDSYAALLCSFHYTRFLLDDNQLESRQFVSQERLRQQRIIRQLPEFRFDIFMKHYGLLQLCDNLSLFLCINEPGKNEHPFFKNGIPIPDTLDCFHGKSLEITWKDNHTLRVNDFPFQKDTSFGYSYKWVTKREITTNGLIRAYKQSSFKQISFSIVS
ncbi:MULTISPECIES: DUF3891 family protein [Virgibacillus]|uniref:DUF3891 family protein n=1 Tax=Virgibacillus kapii TaxID=1638645 RepID=A0ABQ2DR29_9BACI|nr:MULTISPECIES: DUF3891 family protein [Virgibacillus]EQB39049.1 hypothetical protein M948_01475 [Virgibacillus sp. CM-4]MYL43407.1 DUF3891 family protein [Virgibacillus massiliensis]GGJ68567.1 hypothetical protein GCM10007111_32940 [Virgibacillus kapii]